MLTLINEEREPEIIVDPIIRQEVQRQRLRIAMAVCRASANEAQAMLTLLVGAEALKTSNSIRQMLIENPDLAAEFANENTARLILSDSDEIEHHGKILFHRMAVDARAGNRVAVLQGSKWLRAWLDRRREASEKEKARFPNQEPQPWAIDAKQIAAETNAVLHLKGPKFAAQYLQRWRPASIRLQVAILLSDELIISKKGSLIERCITEGHIKPPWSLFVLIPLALSGKSINKSLVEIGLKRLLSRKLIQPEKLSDYWENRNFSAKFLDSVLTACEWVIANPGSREVAISVLGRFVEEGLRRRDNLYAFKIATIDFGLRAFSLLSAWKIERQR